MINEKSCDSLTYLENYISDFIAKKGFFTPSSMDDTQVNMTMADAVLGKLMLVVTELSEAAEAVRKHDLENFAEEIADTFIRLFDICGAMRLNIKDEIYKKMCKNTKRPQRHGKKTNL